MGERVRLRASTLHVKKAVSVALIAALLVTPAVSVARTGGTDPSKQREQVRADKAKVASKVNALRASDAQVEKALDDLVAHVSGQEALLAESRRAAAEARASLEQAQAAADAKAAAIVDLQAAINELAIESLIHPPTQDVVNALESSSVSEAARKESLLALSVNRDADLLDELSSAKEDLEEQRNLAQQAADRAAQKEAEVDGHLQELQAAKAEKERFATDVQTRLDQALGEAANLETIDKKLSADIARRQAALAAKVRANAPRAPSGSGPVRSSGNVSLRTTHGITVASSIADDLDRMLNAAEADGITMGGGGYRDPSSQVALRKAHCGSSQYDIYEKPSSQCSPPTAPPGTSMHEQGLAIDFTYGGSVIGSRSSPAFRWLAAHAASYGFYNLPSEPWHWSTNGR
jgi:LAS superfamily LD-carboxypeptidase LdcB